MGEKFIFIQLRGGMDGLAALRPDNHDVLKQKRPGLMVDGYQETKEGFAFHPVLENHYRLFQNGELSFLQACGLPIQDRSHFKSQDLLETGKFNPHARKGWLAEILEELPADMEAVAFGNTLPIILSGTKKSFNWSSPIVTDEDESLMRMLGELYEGDPALEPLLPQFQRIEYLTGGFAKDERSPDPFQIIGNMLSKKDGPDIGVINLGNWDTHDNQKPRIAKEFANLDKGLGTLRSALKDVWNETVIVIVSEFGRSVHENGTNGSDHGTGGVCVIAGGAVRGGRSLGSWPGLEEEVLFEGRDVMPVHDVRMIFAHVADKHFGMKSGLIEKDIFPDIPTAYREFNIIEKKRGLFGFV